jgi:hypothetical protein
LLSCFIAVLSRWTTPFAMKSGEQAYERYKKGEVAGFLAVTSVLIS